ncbi:DUF998 domain-containing protein [Demequina sp. NBRC 110055]|uniref:DUF998 domain-containing protein n=1 Tax=Demequina sp. NBRC 110055 TaxID=1570344 RepID=UPI000A05A0E7|nr:DUF998 domain-containing protein [Demequina sp. NBRC 110055]
MPRTDPVVTLGRAAIVGALAWVGIIAVLHLLRPDLAPGDAYISNYARGDWAWLMRLAFFLNAAGWVAAGEGMRRTVPGRAGVTLAVLAWLGALGLVIAGVFRADPLGSPTVSAEGWLHSRGAGLAFIALIALGFAGWLAFRDTTMWGRWTRVSLTYGLVASGLLAVYLVWADAVGDGFGWWQRALAFAVIPAWLAALGARLDRIRSGQTEN